MSTYSARSPVQTAAGAAEGSSTDGAVAACLLCGRSCSGLRGTAARTQSPGSLREGAADGEITGQGQGVEEEKQSNAEQAGCGASLLYKGQR